jgi:hypothetical protein
MEVIEVETSPQTLSIPQSKNTELTRAEYLRVAASWSGEALTVLGCGSLAYGLHASSTAFCIAAGALGLPGVILLVGTCASYCCDQAKNDESMALISPPKETSTTTTMNGNNPTSIPTTDGNSLHTATVQEWLASQAQVEENLRRKSLLVSTTTDSTGGTSPPTNVTIDPQKSTRRLTAHNPLIKSSRNPRVRSGEQEIRTPPSRTRSTSQTGTRNSLNVGNNTNSGDEMSETEQEYNELLQKHKDHIRSSRSSFNSDSDS